MGTIAIDQSESQRTNAVYPLETTEILDLTLSLDTNIYASGDVLAATQELAGAVRVVGGTARLDSLVVVDADDQGMAFDVVFLQSNVPLGTENAAPDITDANALKILGIVSVGSSHYLDLGGVRVATVPIAATINLQAEAASTSVYVAAIARDAPTHTAAGLTLRIGVARV